MKCHGDNNVNQGAHNHNPIKHMLHMVLCCGLPVVIIGLLPFISKFSPGSGKFLAVIAPFICPIMMIGMIPMMLGGRGQKKSCCDSSNSEINAPNGPNGAIELNIDKAIEFDNSIEIK